MRDVAEVAAKLHLSERRVRQLLERGSLPGRRVGGRWLVTDADLDAFRDQPRVGGRPWSSDAAWAVLAEVAGLQVRASAVQRSRARKRTRQRRLTELAPQLRHRARLVRCYAHPAALERLAQDGALVLAGESAAVQVGADLIAPTGHLDAYVRDSDLGALAHRYALEVDAERPNLVLRVVSDQLWPFPGGAKVAPAAVVGVDLVESPDERARRAGAALLADA